MGSINLRLIQARKAAGFKSARAAAIKFGWTPSTYASHENGQRNYRLAAAEKYALAFGTRAVWLMHGESGTNNRDESTVTLAPIIGAVVSAMLDLYQIPVRSAGARRLLTEVILEFLVTHKALVSSGRTAELELELLRSLLQAAGGIRD